MGKLLAIKKPFIWIKRFRHRRGYGVHSPFAFDFITNVIYEKSYYYAYESLNHKRGIKKNYVETKKTNRLLFRLVNRAQPKIIIDAGRETGSSDYLKAAKNDAAYINIPDASFLKLIQNLSADFLYIHYSNNDMEFTEKVFYSCIEHIHEKSVFVIQGIHYSGQMKDFWLKILKNDKVIITFDLYDVGVILFDKAKIKQHYTVNF